MSSMVRIIIIQQIVLIKLDFASKIFIYYWLLLSLNYVILLNILSHWLITLLDNLRISLLLHHNWLLKILNIHWLLNIHLSFNWS